MEQGEVEESKTRGREHIITTQDHVQHNKHQLSLTHAQVYVIVLETCNSDFSP